MPKVLVNEENLTNIANAIREKNGETTTYKPGDMATAIQEISGGKYAPRHISFYRCPLKNINDDLSNLDTSNVISMESMFEYSSISTLDVSNFDTRNVTTMKGMFSYASSLTSLDISNFDTSKVTEIDKMFSNNKKLTSLKLPSINGKLIKTLNTVFYDTRELVTLNLGHWDLSNVSEMSSPFYNMSKLENFTFPLNLGAGFDTSMAANHSFCKIDLSKSTLLTHDSLMSVINNIYDIASKGCKVQTLSIGSTNLSKLTEDEIAIATNKGWNVI